MKFPDLIKDPADTIDYTMDWTSRLGGRRIASAEILINGNNGVVDRTEYPASALTLRVSGGDSFGWTGDPQIGSLAVVTVVATLSDGQIWSRSFNVVATPQ